MKSIPVLHVTGRTLAEGYENALVALHRGGIPFRTQYDKPGDPPSLDATLNLVVEDPVADPMIHMAFPGGVADLREYVGELQGLKDAWTRNINDPADTRWEYTYHGRLEHYGRWKERAGEGASRASRFAGRVDLDQIAAVIGKLARQPYTRQAQMITWMPELDLSCFDRLDSTAFADRTLAFHDPTVQEMYHEEAAVILEKVRDMNAQMARQDGAGG